jgi:tetratricopeptide (TPR) repeat protein
LNLESYHASDAFWAAPSPFEAARASIGPMRQPGAGWMGLVACIGVSICLPYCARESSDRNAAEYARAMNRGRAYLENRDGVLAVQAFQQAVAREPDSAPALRNLARGMLMARDTATLADVLERARVQDPESVATAYLLGLMHARKGQFDAAVRAFEDAVRRDPNTATLRFQLANAYQAMGQHAAAVAQMKETLRLDPFFAAAQYRLAGYARRSGDAAELKRRLRELERLRSLFGDQSRSAEELESCVYTLAEPPEAAAARHGPEADGHWKQVRFRDASGEMLPADLERAAPVVAAAVLDVDERGRYTLFLASADARASLLAPGEDGRLHRITLDVALAPAVLASERLVSRAGDFRGGELDEASGGALEVRSDVLLLGDAGAQLLERTGPGSFEDATSHAGLSGVSGHDAHWIDFDHDGDIDLVVAGRSGLALWQNDGDGRFEDVTSSAGIDAGGPVTDVAVGDLDDNVAIDLVAARAARPTLVFENQRTGHFAAQLEPPGPWPSAQLVRIDDLDNDGHLDAALIGPRQVLIVSPQRAARQRIDLGDLEPRAAVLIDFDNDGWLDLLVAGTGSGATRAGRLALWRNAGAEGWVDVSASAHLDAIAMPAVRDAIAADVDADGDSDLLLITTGGLRLLRNDGGNAGGQLKVRLVGTKTNPTGLGTRVEVRAADFQAVRSISSLPIEIGVGDVRKLDAVQTVWTNGVVDNQVQLSVPRTPLTIVERMVATGSCPFLYAWDGQRFRFVTDLLGNAPLGLSLRRGEILDADPDEFVRVGDSHSFVPREGSYMLQVTDEMREVLYLDEARLVAVDHPPGIEVHPNDRLMPAPFPASELVPLRAPRVPRAAYGDDGIDRTAALRAIDGDFAAPGPALPPPLRGLTRPLTLTLDFGPLDDLRAPVLALTGWLQYGDASTNIAASQNRSLALAPTTLEMEGADGRWHSVDVRVGAPAGKTKTIAIDLTGALLPGVRRLRLHSSVALYWDRIALFERLPANAVEIHTARPAAAALAWRGFSEIRSRASLQPTTPEWDVVFERPPWRTTPEGWVTRYGDVRELVTERDGRLAILDGGDALALRFAASDLPPLPPGMVRTFFFYSVGWDKDGDHNVVDGDRVEPLPVDADADDGWRIRYNTRWVPAQWPALAPQRGEGAHTRVP